MSTNLSSHSITRRDALLTPLLSWPFLQNPVRSIATPLTAVEHITVIDGTGAVLRDRTVVIRLDRILAIGETRSLVEPAGSNVIDGKGLFMIPGLFDAHAHLSYFKASALPTLLANGVTSVRDMGGLLNELDLWRTETDTGVRLGPRIYRAGPILNGKQFNEFQVAVRNAAEARGAVRVLQRSGVDFIKVHAAISREAYFGVHAECKELDFRYAGHMPRAITPEEASDAGELTLEHVGAFTDRFASEGVAADDMVVALRRFRQREAPRMFERFARNHTWFTPTLIASKSAIHLGDHRPDPRDKYVSTSCKKITAELLKRPSYREFLQPASIARQEHEFQELLPLVGLMNQRGVRLLAGTDFAVSIIYPGFSLHEEMELLVTAGLSPMAALQAATLNPAHVLGQTDLGSIAAGKLADLVLLEADPLADIRNIRKIHAVVSRGRVIGRTELDWLLTQAAIEAEQT